MSGIAWTEADIARLKELWRQGLSAAAIGRVMGITKNAVVGKSHRLGLPARPSPIRPSTGRPPKKAATYRGAAAVMTARAAMRSPAAPPSSATRPPLVPTAHFRAAGAGATSSAAGVPREADAGLSAASGSLPETRPALSQAAPAPFPGGNERGCRWPLWGHQERPTHRFCEAQRRDVACPYCPTHAALAFERRQPTGALAAWNPQERKFHRASGQGNLTAGARFYA